MMNYSSVVIIFALVYFLFWAFCKITGIKVNGSQMVFIPFVIGGVIIICLTALWLYSPVN